jgi:hypothetical protein
LFSQRKSWDWFFQSIKNIQSGENNLVEIRTVFVRINSEWRHYATCLFISTNDISNNSDLPEQCIFDNLALVKKFTSIQDISDIDKLKKAIVTWDDLNLSYSNADFGEDIAPQFYGSFNEYGRLPLWRIDLTSTTKGRQIEPEGPFLHQNLPLFMSVEEAASEWLGEASILQNHYPSQPYLCLLKSSSGWFEDIKLNEDSKLVVRINLPSESDGWVVKLVAKGIKKTVRSTQMAQSKIIFALPSDVKEITLCLTDKDTKVQDFFTETQYRSSWLRSVISPGIVRGEQEMMKIIHRGESQSLEFKEWLPITGDKPKRWELHRAVVAFANTKGGTILIGVNDNGEIVGIDHNLQTMASSLEKDDRLNSYQSEIRKLLNREITPTVEFSFETMGLGSQSVLAIHITEGKEKPYRLIKDDEIFIRVGSNNMRPTPDELKQLLCSKPLFPTSIG